jgi:hypothetical protein
MSMFQETKYKVTNYGNKIQYTYHESNIVQLLFKNLHSKRYKGFENLIDMNTNKHLAQTKSRWVPTRQY